MRDSLGMNISVFRSDTWTEQQRQLYERITREEREYPNCIAAALGYLNGRKQEEPFDPKAAFSYIEALFETTQAPAFGALAVWHSNPISLMTTNYAHTTSVRHAGIVLGIRFNSLYVFDQMRARVYVDPVDETTRRVDAFSKERYGERYTGIVEIKYHSLDVVLQ